VFRLPTKLSAALEDTVVVTFLRRYQSYLAGAFTVLRPAGTGAEAGAGEGAGDGAGEGAGEGAARGGAASSAGAAATSSPGHGGGKDSDAAGYAPASAPRIVWGSGVLRGLPLHSDREASARHAAHGGDGSHGEPDAAATCSTHKETWALRQYADVVVPEFLILAVNALVSTLPAGKL
jgi:hypothetical protein